MELVKVVHARAPIRINDIGGWTDTWFAGRGKVLNVAVDPAVEVELRVLASPRRIKARVTVHAENFGESFAMDPDRPRTEPHGLLQFAVGALPPEAGLALEVRIHSSVPAGISTGTSAAVSVALLGALAALRPRPLDPQEIARLAHRVETENLGQQSGIQDQLAAAHGGISFIDMRTYPEARVIPVRVPPATRAELGRRLHLVYLGSPHRSSSMHDAVIAALEAGGPQMDHIRALTAIAAAARRHLEAGDLEAYGEDMVLNHERQRGLHPGLIAASADAVAAVARRHGALGWKVNGAGGKGGSMTVLAGSDDGPRRGLVRSLDALGRGVRVIPIALSETGVRAWTV